MFDLFSLLINRVFSVVTRKGSQWSLSSSRHTVVTSVVIQGTRVLTIFHPYPTGRENLEFRSEGKNYFICPYTRSEMRNMRLVAAPCEGYSSAPRWTIF